MEKGAVNREIINLIKAQYDVTKNKIACLGLLLNKFIDEEDKKLLTDILIIKNKHLKMLSDLNYRFEGERLGKDLPEGEDPGGCLSSKLGKAALEELEDAETYRGLSGDFLNQSVRDSFIEMMTDSQNNAQRLLILLVKYS